MSNELLISLFSAVAALLSALYAVRSTRIAKKALSIAEEEFNSRKESLKLYLVEGINYITSEEVYVFGFNVSITNEATAPNAIQRIELLITFVRSDDTTGNIILQHDASLHGTISGHEVTPFSIPREVPAKSAITNWCLFRCGGEVKKFGRIDKYTLRITDTSGNVCEVESYLIKEYRIV